jgi:hypothetical protein
MKDITKMRFARNDTTYSNPVIPIRPGTWPATIFIADPVINPLTAGVGMNSTSQPRRKRPIPSTINPQTKASVVAISGPDHLPGCAASTARITWATVSDITATGPIETSFEVAKNCEQI